jgi:cell division protein FtsL
MKSKPRDSSFEKFFFLSILFISFFTILGLLYVYENVEYTSLSYKYMTLKKEYENLIHKNEKLNDTVEKLSSPSRIERYARLRLGMAYPKKTVYIDIYPSEVKVASSSEGKYIASP